MPIDAALAERFRAYGTPELADEPTPEQLDAWLELAVLASDDDFVRSTREASAWLWQHAVEPIDSQAWGQAMRALGERAAALVEAGAPPGDAAVDALIDELVEWHARVLGREDTPELRAWLSHQFETHSDPRAPRYWELVATVCGGPADSAMRRTAAGFTWLLEALKGQIARRARHDGEPTAPVG